MLLYKFYNPNPAGKMVRDCVVRAICKAENLSWEFAYLSICAAGLVEYDMPDGNDTGTGGKCSECKFDRYTDCVRKEIKNEL